jgi:histidine triad (HIT) family protein
MSEANECLFCQIINKKIPAEIVYEDEATVVFPDINPKARVHFLVVPRTHIASFLDLNDNQFTELTNLAKVVQILIKKEKLESGYQLLFNGGRAQHVPHLHWHLLGD